MADRSAAQAVDQQRSCAAEQIVWVDCLLARQAQIQGPLAHDSWQAATRERRGAPARGGAHQQVGRGAAAKLAGVAEQQGVIGSGLVGLAAGLNGGSVVEGFAAAQQARGAAPFGGAHDHAPRLKGRFVGAQLQPKAMGCCGQGRDGDAAAGAAPAPVEPQGACANAAAPQRFLDQRSHHRAGWWWVHAQQLRALLPAPVVLLQPLGATVEDQHRFKHPIGQEQTPIGQGDRQLCGAAPAAFGGRLIDPGQGRQCLLRGLLLGGLLLGGVLRAHARASSRGLSFQPISSASAWGSESATMPQPACTRSRWSLITTERIRMLLSNWPCGPSQNREPQ